MKKDHLNNKFTARFKQAISLDRCILKDLDDEVAFELQVLSSSATGTRDVYLLSMCISKAISDTFFYVFPFVF